MNAYAERLLVILDRAIAALEPWAEWTPIQSDDGLLTLFRAIKADASLLGYVAKKAEEQDQGVLSLETHPTQELQAALSAKGIAWEVFQALLPLLLKRFAMGS